MLVNKVESTIKKFGMFQRGDNVLVAVSGGPDSVALLDILSCLSGKYEISLSVAHLNHMLRGADAARDADFVRQLCAKYKCACFLAEKDAGLFTKESRLSPEEAARKLRYDYLCETARSHGMNKVATGHTADDQAETVMLALIRGCGLAGLSGIPPVRDFGKAPVKIVRPLIEISRAQVEEYLAVRNIDSRIDSSNLGLNYSRNRVRLKLLPFLEREYNPKIKAVLGRLASILREDNNYLDKTASGFAEEKLLGSENRKEIRLKELESVPLALQQRVIRLAVNEVQGSRSPLSSVHWEQIRKLVSRGRSGSRVILPGGCFVKKQREKLVIGVNEGQDTPINVSCGLKVPGKNHIEEMGLVVDSVCLCESLPVDFGKQRNVGYFDYDSVQFPLNLRYRYKGDRFVPLGMRGRKKLQDFFIDSGVPVEKRDVVPLLISNGEIIWVIDSENVGWGRIAERVKVTEKTGRILKVKVESLS